MNQFVRSLSSTSCFFIRTAPSRISPHVFLYTRMCTEPPNSNQQFLLVTCSISAFVMTSLALSVGARSLQAVRVVAVVVRVVTWPLRVCLRPLRFLLGSRNKAPLSLQSHAPTKPEPDEPATPLRSHSLSPYSSPYQHSTPDSQGRRLLSTPLRGDGSHMDDPQASTPAKPISALKVQCRFRSAAASAVRSVAVRCFTRCKRDRHRGLDNAFWVSGDLKFVVGVGLGERGCRETRETEHCSLDPPRSRRLNAPLERCASGPRTPSGPDNSCRKQGITS